MSKLALQSNGYIKWIAESFRPRRGWEWVDQARALLGGMPPPTADPSSSGRGIELDLQDLVPSGKAYSILLRRCGQSSSLAAGERVHAHIVHNGYARDSFIGNMLAQMYGRCGRSELARCIFDAMADPDKFSWNIMITAYAQNGQHREAAAVFDLMRSRRIQGDAFICASALGAIARCSGSAEARLVFDSMVAETVLDRAAWTAMVTAYAQDGLGSEAMKLLRVMDLEGIGVNELTIVSTITACSASGLVDDGKALYSALVAQGYAGDAVVIETALLNLHSKSGSLADAEAVFAAMEHPDVAAYTSMVEAYTRHGRGQAGVVLYRRMCQDGISPDVVTYVAVLTACSFCADVAEGRRVHGRMDDEVGVVNANAVAQTALVNMYGRAGQLAEARAVFDSVPAAKRDVVTWNVMLAAYVQYERPAEAFELYGRMGGGGDVVTYGIMLSACCGEAELGLGRRLHRQMAGSVQRQEAEVHNAVLSMYGRCGSIAEARRVFDRMPKWDTVSWNAMLSWYTRYGLFEQTVELYGAMVGEVGVEPDAVSYVAVLTACSGTGRLAEGRQVHERLRAGQVKPDVVLETCLVNMYAKCGTVVAARCAFEAMVSARNIVTYNSMMAAYAQHGRVEEVDMLYQRLALDGLVPDIVTLLCMLMSCSHRGLYRKGRDRFVAVRGDYGVEDIADHYHCIVGLLARAGRLQEAEEVIRLMPYEPNDVGWKSLLGGCVIHGDPSRAARAASNACQLDPLDSSQYVLLSNMCAKDDNKGAPQMEGKIDELFFLSL